jgi:hypothetical protein
MRIDTIGKLLLGITASNDTSEVFLVAAAGTNDHCGMGIKTNNNVHDGYYAFHDSDASFRGSMRYDHSADAMFFTTNGNTERIRLDANGRLLVGTSSNIANTTSAKFQVSYTKSTEFGIHVRPSDNNTGGGQPMLFQNQAGGTVGSISATASGVSYNETSDYRLKENDVAILDGITRLKKLRPIRFNWKADTEKTQDGFFAHEVTSAVPEAVTGEKDGTKMQQMDNSKLVPLLVAAVQELIGKVEKLEAA